MKLKFSCKKYSLILILLNFLILGCSASEATEDIVEEPYIPPTTGYDEAYIVTPGTGAGDIRMQYVTNFFTPDEERFVMVHGNDGSATWNYAHIEVNGKRHTAPIGTGLNLHRDGNKFTVPIKITENGFSDDRNDPTQGSISAEGTTFYDSDAPTQFVKIAKREYKVHYSCMNNCNVFGILGNNTLENVQRAFSEANTEFIKVDENLALPEQVFDLTESTEEDEVNNLIAKLKPKINELSNSNYNTWDNNQVAIFGCQNYTANYLFFYDVSFRIPFSDDSMVGAVFIFTQRSWYNDTSQPDLEKQEITSRVIHELGHIRGMRLNKNFGYVLYLTHGTKHNDGHNGKNNGICLMRVPGNTDYDPKYTVELFRKTIAEPHFCYGHIQMLYNCTFIEGE